MNKNKQISLSKVEQGLNFHGIENSADIIATIQAMPGWGGVTAAEVSAVEHFYKHGNLNTLCDALGLVGEERFSKGLDVIEKVEKYEKNLENQNAYEDAEAAE